MAKLLSKISPLITVIIFYSFTIADNDSQDLEQEINSYFARLEDSFSKIASSNALKDRKLRTAEMLFVKAMKKNSVYNTFIRTNSKGVVISEVVRGKKTERPMRDISDQHWFNYVKSKGEPYYDLIKDSDEGRYYLFWARPILKGNRVLGTVLAKIDLWDGFYDISKNSYFPFLIKLGNKTLFVHKVNKEEKKSSQEVKDLSINGIKKISLVIFSESSSDASNVIEQKKDTSATPALTTIDTTKKEEGKKKQKKGGSTVIILILVILFGGIGIGSYLLINWIQRRAFLKRLDEEDSSL